jgi:hypothetical protein
MHPIDGNSSTEAEVGEGFLEKVYKPLQLSTTTLLCLPKLKQEVTFTMQLDIR